MDDVAGDAVSKVCAEGLPGDLSCSLLRWVSGRRYFRRTGPGVRVLHEVGRLMAVMHDQAEQFVPPESFTRPVWDGDRLFEPPGAVRPEADSRHLGPTGRYLLHQAERQARSEMDHLGDGREVFGLIHADLIQSNYLVHGDSVHVIDFADCGFGYHLYDMAVTLFGLWGLDHEGRQREAFLAGYRQVRALAPGHETLLDVFIAARAVVQARFVMTSTHPADQRMAPAYLAKVLDGLRRWLLE